MVILMEVQRERNTIKFASSRFGELEVESSSVIEFVDGLIGFAQDKQFVLLDYHPPFSWLHCITNPQLAFVVVSGGEFGDSYRVEPPVGDRDIDLRADDEVSIINLVSVRPNASETTANLKAPIIVNLRNRRGKQIILDTSDYSTRFPLFPSDENDE